MKLTEKQKQEVQSYIDLVKKLKGNPRYEKSLQNGIQDLLAVEVNYQTSKKGNKMLVITWQNLQSFATSKAYYMEFRKNDYAKAQKVKEGDLYQCFVSGQGNFINVKPILNIGQGSPLQAPPLATAHVVGYDMEVYMYNWSVTFTDVLTDIDFVINDNIPLLKKFLDKHNESVFIGYNNKGYDTHILKSIVDGKNPYELSQQIINGEDKAKIFKMYDQKCISLIEADIMQDNRGFSLKEHMAFMGMEVKESDVSFDIDRELTPEEIEQNNYYNINDVKGTNARFMAILGSLKTKALICDMYDIPYTGLFMTNANLIAEILKAEWHEDRGDYYNPYEAPEWLRFDNVDILKQVAYWVWNGQPLRSKMKDGEIKDDLSFDIKLRDLVVQVGSGGVHGAVPNYIKNDCLIYQDDVGSLYPNTAVLNDYISRNIPKEYRHFYAEILEKRMKYKAEGDKEKEQAMKLILNTFYGVLRAKFNKLYDPRQAIMINLTGQLALLDLAEKIEPHAYISALNTDSINYEPFSDEDKKAIELVKEDWCKRTGYKLDQDVITNIAQRDVNNYVCRFDNGKVKKKGAVSLGGGIKVNKAIVYTAVSNYFMDGKAPEDTIKECDDLLQFQIISKTGWTYQATRLYQGDEWKEIQKVNRSYAIKEGTSHETGVIRKWKEATTRVKDNVIEDVPEQIVKGIPNEPDLYTIDNNSIENAKVKRSEIDEEYYIKLAKMEIMAYELSKEELKSKLKGFEFELDEYGENVE